MITEDDVPQALLDQVQLLRHQADAMYETAVEELSKHGVENPDAETAKQALFRCLLMYNLLTEPLQKMVDGLPLISVPQ